MKSNNSNIANKLISGILIGLLIITVSFKSEPNEAAQKSKTHQIESRTDLFISKLKNGKPLASLFANNWTLIYHEDNRFSGSTDGQLETLKTTQVDSVISLKVKNDGDGWASEKTSPKTFNFDFDLKKQIENWDRFEIANYENVEKDTVYILGAGESDYIQLFYNDKDLIVKMKYSSEDPG